MFLDRFQASEIALRDLRVRVSRNPRHPSLSQGAARGRAAPRLASVLPRTTLALPSHLLTNSLNMHGRSSYFLNVLGGGHKSGPIAKLVWLGCWDRSGSHLPLYPNYAVSPCRWRCNFVSSINYMHTIFRVQRRKDDETEALHPRHILELIVFHASVRSLATGARPDSSKTRGGARQASLPSTNFGVWNCGLAGPLAEGRPGSRSVMGLTRGLTACTCTTALVL